MNLPVFDEQRLSKLDQLWVTDGDVLYAQSFIT